MKRYTLWHSSIGNKMIERDDGPWIYHSDHQAEVGRLTQRILDLERRLARRDKGYSE